MKVVLYEVKSSLYSEGTYLIFTREISMKGENNMKEKVTMEVKDDVVTAQTSKFCEAVRSCCLHPGCLGTFIPLSGSTWVLDHCGCDDDVIWV